MLRDILRSKGDSVCTCSPGNTLEDVIRELVQRNIGSLIVVDGESMVGIITERDILRATARYASAAGAVTVAECMTSAPVTAAPDAAIEDVMGLMTARRIRHLPVMDDGRLVGIVSIGDIVKAQHDALSQENHYLKSYLYESAPA